MFHDNTSKGFFYSNNKHNWKHLTNFFFGKSSNYYVKKHQLDVVPQVW